MEIDQYWGVTTSDLAKEGWHVDEHYAHMFFFNYLRFSPSYLLARKANTTGLSLADKKSLPKDFDQVLKTYDLLGDVHNTLFRYWWQRMDMKSLGCLMKNLEQKLSLWLMVQINPQNDIKMSWHISWQMSDNKKSADHL